MKVTVCDVCKKDNATVLVKAKWKFNFKKGVQRFRVDVCESHKNWASGKDYDSALAAITNSKV